MNFIDKIVSDPKEFNCLQHLLIELKNSRHPLYIYGAGESASVILNGFDKEGIKVNGLFVDEQYWHKNLKLHDHTVAPLNRIFTDVVGGGEKINVIVGYDESIDVITEKLSKYNDNINKIYHIDFADFLLTFDDGFTYKYLLENHTQLQQVYDLCEDSLSRRVFCGFINARLTKNTKYLNDICTHDIYHPKEIIKLNSDETFIDCGAYDCDSILQFIDKVNGKYNKIIAFEPDTYNMQLLSETIKKRQIQNIECHNAGVWNKSGYLGMINTGDERSKLTDDDSKNTVAVESIDDVLKDCDLQNGHLFIKMDIEGSELQALKGAEETIKRYKPKCAICVYHKKEDIFEIPLYLKKLNLDYKIYFRQHHYYPYDMVCYAIL